MSPAELLSTVLFTLYTTVPSESVCSVPQPVGVRCALGLDNSRTNRLSTLDAPKDHSTPPAPRPAAPRSCATFHPRASSLGRKQVPTLSWCGAAAACAVTGR